MNASRFIAQTSLASISRYVQEKFSPDRRATNPWLAIDQIYCDNT